MNAEHGGFRWPVFESLRPGHLITMKSISYGYLKPLIQADTKSDTKIRWNFFHEPARQSHKDVTTAETPPYLPAVVSTKGRVKPVGS
jgi:hypothetical protein